MRKRGITAGLASVLLICVTACSNPGNEAMRDACHEVNQMLLATMHQNVRMYTSHWDAASDYADRAAKAVPQWREARELSHLLNLNNFMDPTLRAEESGDVCTKTFPD